MCCFCKYFCHHICPAYSVLCELCVCCWSKAVALLWLSSGVHWLQYYCRPGINCSWRRDSCFIHISTLWLFKDIWTVNKWYPWMQRQIFVSSRSWLWITYKIIQLGSWNWYFTVSSDTTMAYFTTVSSDATMAEKQYLLLI